MKKRKKIYKKPKLSSKRIRINHFLTNRRFFGDVEDLLIPNVFASGGY